MNDPVQMIPIDRIRIINPRARDRAKFQPIIDSIKALGVKKPIQVNIRPSDDGQGPVYDLICGQGRIEACKILGFTEIPAVVVDIPKEDRMLRSLVENMARRLRAVKTSSMKSNVSKISATPISRSPRKLASPLSLSRAS